MSECLDGADDGSTLALCGPQVTRDDPIMKLILTDMSDTLLLISLKGERAKDRKNLPTQRRFQGSWPYS